MESLLTVCEGTRARLTLGASGMETPVGAVWLKNVWSPQKIMEGGGGYDFR